MAKQFKPLTYGSLFSGIGGLDLGLELAGMVCAWQSEVDPYCSEVLAEHWPNTPNLGDVSLIDWSEVEPVDCLAGGFPCQPVSEAGLKRAQEDVRWLWPEFYRALYALRPRYVVVENVPGLLQRGLGIVLGDLASLGYDAEWQMLPAASVGAPHIRKRIFIVAYPNSAGRSGRTRNLSKANGRDESADSHNNGAHSDGAGSQGLWAEYGLRQGQGQGQGEAFWPRWWAVEPDVGRMAYGVPHRVDRLVALGNAVVPAVAEQVGNYIYHLERN